MQAEDFQQLFFRNQDRLYRFALRIVRDTAVAEDVVQEVLIKCWKSNEKISELQNPDAWLLRVTKNLAIDKIRASKYQTTDLEHAKELKDRGPDPGRQTVNEDLMALLRKLLERLPEKQRMIFHLREIEGLAYKEICEAMGLSLQDVKVTLHRARKKIKDQLVTADSYGLQ